MVLDLLEVKAYLDMQDHVDLLDHKAFKVLLALVVLGLLVARAYKV